MVIYFTFRTFNYSQINNIRFTSIYLLIAFTFLYPIKLISSFAACAVLLENAIIVLQVEDTTWLSCLEVAFTLVCVVKGITFVAVVNTICPGSIGGTVTACWNDLGLAFLGD